MLYKRDPSPIQSFVRRALSLAKERSLQAHLIIIIIKPLAISENRKWRRNTAKERGPIMDLPVTCYFALDMADNIAFQYLLG